MYLLKKYSATLFLLCVLIACSAKPLAPLAPSDTILAFGDSLTAGYGTKSEYSYPSVLEALSGHTVINAGISGETTTSGLARYEEVLEKHDPALVILIEGGNDILRNQSFSGIKNNLGEMISITKAKNIEIIILGVPEKKIFSDAAPFYQELANEYGIVLHNSLLSTLMRKSDLKSDQIHLNQKGYRKMAEEIYKLLQDNGAL